MAGERTKRRVWQCPSCEKRYKIRATAKDPERCPKCKDADNAPTSPAPADSTDASPTLLIAGRRFSRRSVISVAGMLTLVPMLMFVAWTTNITKDWMTSDTVATSESTVSKYEKDGLSFSLPWYWNVTEDKYLLAGEPHRIVTITSSHHSQIILTLTPVPIGQNWTLETYVSVHTQKLAKRCFDGQRPPFTSHQRASTSKAYRGFTTTFITGFGVIKNPATTVYYYEIKGTSRPTIITVFVPAKDAQKSSPAIDSVLSTIKFNE